MGEGDTGEDMYILMEGRVEMTTEVRGAKTVLGERTTASETAWFGAVALVSLRNSLEPPPHPTHTHTHTHFLPRPGFAQKGYPAG